MGARITNVAEGFNVAASPKVYYMPIGFQAGKCNAWR
jgi:hypothetical protein